MYIIVYAREFREPSVITSLVVYPFLAITTLPPPTTKAAPAEPEAEIDWLPIIIGIIAAILIIAIIVIIIVCCCLLKSKKREKVGTLGGCFLMFGVKDRLLCLVLTTFLLM